MKKRVFTLFLAFALLSSLCVAYAVNYGDETNPNEKTYQQTFSDVPTDHWAFQFIGELVERKAIAGYPDGKFYPDNIVTRQEFAKIMVVAAGLTATPVQASSYADVPITHWASPFVEAASVYMTAYRNSATGTMNFKPEAGALREDIAVAVVKMRGYDTRLADLSLLDTMFSDVDGISAAAKPYVALAVENKIISGYTDGTFRAQNTIARSEAAAILWRAFQYGSDEKVIGNELPTATTTPKPTTSPKPTVSPAPTASPAPKTEKPYIADMVVRAQIANTSQLMTMDSDCNLIYYDVDKDAILSLNPDTKETSTLLDVSTATYTVTVPAEAENPAATVTYENLNVKQVFWDNTASRLLLSGEFQGIQTTVEDDGWIDPSHPDGQKYQAIFTLTEGNLTFFGATPSGIRNGDYYFSSILCAMDNGNFVVSYDYNQNNYRHYSSIVDFGSGNIITKLEKNGYYDHDAVIQSGRDIYRVSGCLIAKYDYGTGEWVNTGDVPLYKALNYQNAAFYTWTSEEICATKPTGQKKTLLNPSTDVDVLDLSPLPGSPDNIFVTTDECYLFYDDSAKAIRMISPNPNY